MLDACSQICIFDCEQNREVNRQNVWVEDLSLPERLTILVNLDVRVVICCAVSDVLHKLLKSKNIQVIAGRIGELEEVLEAFIGNQLDNQSFLMPGYKK